MGDGLWRVSMVCVVVYWVQDGVPRWNDETMRKAKKNEVCRGGLGPPFEMYCGRPWFSFLGCPEAARGTTFLNHGFGGFGCFGRVRLFVTVQARTVAPNWASRRLSLCDQFFFFFKLFGKSGTRLGATFIDDAQRAFGGSFGDVSNGRGARVVVHPNCATGWSLYLYRPPFVVCPVK